MSHEDTNRLSGHEKDVLRSKYGTNKLSGSQLDEGRKNKKKEMAKKMKDKYTGKKGEYSKVRQGNWEKVHPLDRK